MLLHDYNAQSYRYLTECFLKYWDKIWEPKAIYLLSTSLPFVSGMEQM